MTAVTIRDAGPERDAAACAAIYAPYVETTPISFEERPPTAAEMATRIARVVATHPWLVAEAGGEVVGYAYGCPLRERPAYRWVAEVTVYVADDRRGSGIGRKLYEALFERLRGQRFQVAFAGITLPNGPSVALHERLDFARVGVSPRIGWKQGDWHDVSWWQLDLAPPEDEQPPEPLPPGPPPAPGYH
ncbi:MAG TPA: GNAT family N-acetyltransferase [Solirubrobacterales bacterium]|nr:GNAT family N-acetyltransferase [Solirubrobacterales bacterium]